MLAFNGVELNVIVVVLGIVRTQYVVPAMILLTVVDTIIGMPTVKLTVDVIAGMKVTTFVPVVVLVIVPMNCDLAILRGRPICFPLGCAEF
jgi:hypothetical protein